MVKRKRHFHPLRVGLALAEHAADIVEPPAFQAAKQGFDLPAIRPP